MRFVVWAFLTLLPLSAVRAGDRIETIGIWDVYLDQKHKTCRIIAAYENDEAVIVEYDAVGKRTEISFSEKNATSLKTGDKKKLHIYFVDGKRLDDGWEDIEFTAYVADNGTRLLNSGWLNPPILQDVSEGRVIGFYYGDKLIGSYNLTESAKAVVALERCAMRAAGINPRDPFAN